MKNLFASVLVMSTAFAAPTFAGGPVIIQEEGNPEVITEGPPSSIGVLPVLLGVVVLCAVLCGGDDDEVVPVGSEAPCRKC